MAHAHHHAEQVDFAAENKKHFDAKAKELDVNPEFQEVGRQIGAAIFKLHGSLFDPSATEAMDFACGTGFVSFEITPRVKSLLGVDISGGMVERFNERASELNISPEKTRAVAAELKSDDTELGGKKFDVVLCSVAYHHFGDIAATTKLLAFFLKPGGSLIVVDFIKREDVKNHEVPEEFRNIVAHAGGFTEAQIRDVFEGAGLQEFSFAFAFATRIQERDFDIFVARGVKP